MFSPRQIGKIVTVHHYIHCKWSAISLLQVAILAQLSTWIYLRLKRIGFSWVEYSFMLPNDYSNICKHVILISRPHPTPPTPCLILKMLQVSSMNTLSTSHKPCMVYEQQVSSRNTLSTRHKPCMVYEQQVSAAAVVWRHHEIAWCCATGSFIHKSHSDSMLVCT